MSESVLIEHSGGVTDVTYESNGVTVIVIDWDRFEEHPAEAFEQLRYMVEYAEFTNLPGEDWARVVKRLADMVKGEL